VEDFIPVMASNAVRFRMTFVPLKRPVCSVRRVLEFEELDLTERVCGLRVAVGGGGGVYGVL
jgi:hypothetical protein